MSTIEVGSTEYRALARRYAELTKRRQAGDISDATYAELCKVSDAMTDAEMDHDYEFLVSLAGHLGGAEVL